MRVKAQILRIYAVCQRLLSGWPWFVIVEGHSHLINQFEFFIFLLFSCSVFMVLRGITSFLSRFERKLCVYDSSFGSTALHCSADFNTANEASNDWILLLHSVLVRSIDIQISYFPLSMALICCIIRFTGYLSIIHLLLLLVVPQAIDYFLSGKSFVRSVTAWSGALPKVSIFLSTITGFWMPCPWNVRVPSGVITIWNRQTFRRLFA